MQKIDIDFFLILVAAIAQWALTLFWYSSWFQEKAHSNSTKTKQVKKQVGVFVAGVVLALFLAIIEGFIGVMTTADGVIVGLGVALGLIGTTKMQEAFFKKISWKGYCSDLIFWIISLILMGGILAV